MKKSRVPLHVLLVAAMALSSGWSSAASGYELTIDQEKELLLQFKASRSFGRLSGRCDASSRKRSLRWNWASEGMEQWHVARPLCSFEGIDCYEDGHVKRIQLGCMDVTGRLPTEWHKLQLTEIHLQDNELEGPLPPEWEAMPNLTKLDLGHNQLTGTLPQSWSKLNATDLRLQHNLFIGQLPPTWLRPGIETLRIDNNYLTTESYYDEPWLTWGPQLGVWALKPPPSPPPPPPSPPNPSPSPPPPFPPFPAGVHSKPRACSKDDLDTQLGESMFYCVSYLGSDWTQWAPWTTQKCCRSLSYLNYGDCLCASWLYSIKTTGYGIKDTKLLVNIARQVCGMPVMCTAPPPMPASPPPQVPPFPPVPLSPPRVPSDPPPPPTEPPPCPMQPSSPPAVIDVASPPPRSPSLPTYPLVSPPPPQQLQPNEPPQHSTQPPPYLVPAPPLQQLEPEPPQHSRPPLSPIPDGTLSNGNATPPNSSSQEHHDLRMDIELTIMVEDSTHPILSSLDEQANTAPISMYQAFLIVATAGLSPFKVSTVNVRVVDVCLGETPTALVARLSVPAQSRADAEYWASIPPPEVRQHVQEAGINGVVWAGISIHKIHDELVDDTTRTESPAVAFAVTLGCSIGVLAGCAVLDKVRSSTRCCMDRREAPVHSELLFPLIAVLSLAFSVWYTVYFLAGESPSLLIASISCLGLSVIFNACTASLYIARSDMMRPGADQKRCFSSDQGPGGNSLDSTGLHCHRPSKWALCSAGLAAFANVGCLKLLICDVGDWCRRSSSPKHMRRLSALGLMAALLGDLSHIVIVMTHIDGQGDEGHQWPAPVMASIILSGNVLLISLVTSLRMFLCTHAYPMKIQGLGSQHSAFLINISLSSAGSTPQVSPTGSAMAVAESCVLENGELMHKELCLEKPGIPTVCWDE